MTFVRKGSKLIVNLGIQNHKLTQDSNWAGARVRASTMAYT